VTVEIFPLQEIPEIVPGDDLGAALVLAVLAGGPSPVDGDGVVVTQKVVSKAEGRVVSEWPEGKATWVARETRRVVASRDDMIIAETRHGFVCANAGVDASNVAEGFLTLLPEDPDGSAEKIRRQLAAVFDVRLGVVITDTFGRPWRHGLVNIAIGCAGIPALVDLRGTQDATGRVLEATIVALADEVAAASGLVMAKASGIPAAIVRGVDLHGVASPASSIVRDRDEDLFRESPLQAIHGRRSIRRFESGPVARPALERAVLAACTAPAPHHTRPWLFVGLESELARKRLIGAMAEAWEADLRADGTPDPVIERRRAKSDALLLEAPVLIVPCVRLTGAHVYADEERSAAELQMFLLSGGAAIQNLMLALHAQGLASCWVSSTLFCKEETRHALGLPEYWIPLGSLAVGRPPAGEPPARPPLDATDFLVHLE